MVTSFSCRVDGREATAQVLAEGLALEGRTLAYVDLDAVALEELAITVTPYDAAPVRITHLAARRDEFVRDLLAARADARRAALLQWTGDRPIDSYLVGATGTRTVLFADAVTVEPVSRPTAIVPFGLLRAVERDGYRFTFRAVGLTPVTVGPFGPRTDEFVQDLERARAGFAARSAAAYAALDDRLAGFAAPLGTAVCAADAGGYWGALRAAVAGEETDLLADLAGDGLRIGIAALAREQTMPFLLAPTPRGVAVEGAGEQARATYVFATDDIDRLGAALLLTSFRREALYLPPEQLGRWALAVRTSEVVRWARSVLAGRVVHDAGWAEGVRALLAS